MSASRERVPPAEPSDQDGHSGAKISTKAGPGVLTEAHQHAPVGLMNQLCNHGRGRDEAN